MLMPEASVHENHSLVTRKNDVGAARQIAAIQAKAVTETMQTRSNDPFRARMLLRHFRHYPASDFGCNGVDHLRRLQSSSGSDSKQKVVIIKTLENLRNATSFLTLFEILLIRLVGVVNQLLVQDDPYVLSFKHIFRLFSAP